VSSTRTIKWSWETMEVMDSTATAFDMDQYEQELDAIIAEVIPDKEA